MKEIIIAKKGSDKKDAYPSEWVPHPDGGEYLIAGLYKPSFQYVQETYQSQERAIRNSGSLITDEFVEESNRKFSAIVGKYLVLDWKDIPSKLEYSPDNAADLMAYGSTEDDPEYGIRLSTWVLNQAQRIQISADKEKIAVLGKSQPSTITPTNSRASRTTKKSKEKRSA
ncbi:hypothetical protein [Acinetobacter baumannii]|uniref:hypothetical protein n=1 Tax=Acinetobacter baumannii TaxID=470 RepID=UPI0011269355|nr:hypothetical protein [Acinetobacter baumannii]EKU1551261.1 hypothetical protein [Acinetobacter baumannii]EKU2690939.1 hypothetical protein [Acinetobacter baumannii]EKU5255742.1 hypothetical protein [Acinetobacter baumannii]EKU6962127.1 hypothetical protein [Acinetobacter baumannii]EKU7214367.1 hypothetical protein [Acinetobacter baumannii]